MDKYYDALQNFREIKNQRLDAQKHNAVALCNFKLGLYEEAEVGFREH